MTLPVTSTSSERLWNSLCLVTHVLSPGYLPQTSNFIQVTASPSSQGRAVAGWPSAVGDIGTLLSLTQCFCFFSSSTSLLTLKHGGMCNQREERLGRKVLTIFCGFWKSLHHWELLIYNFLTWVTAFLLAGPSQCFAGLLGFWLYTSRSFSWGLLLAYQHSF